ncbi:MAG: thioesterase family protein [Candidatus Pacebacteria bacterium]|nr:thioesterase family protein [Candidatus Paceibacterota bacterium]
MVEQIKSAPRIAKIAPPNKNKKMTIGKTKNKFRYSVFVSIGDTCNEQTVYWANYSDMLGKAREIFFASIFPKFRELASSGAQIVTHETYIKHISSAYFGDEIIIEIVVGEVKKTSAKISVDFIMKETGKKIAEGWQVLVFTNNEGRPAPIPAELKEAVLQYVV